MSMVLRHPAAKPAPSPGAAPQVRLVELLHQTSGSTLLAIEARPEGSAEVTYLCSQVRCPHWKGQPGLWPAASTMQCALVGYAPERTCQPIYQEGAELLDKTRRNVWAALDEAEELERQRHQAQAAANDER